jgi:RHS repeat-associated protein
LKPVAELDGSGALVAQFAYGSKPNVPDYVMRGGATYRVVSDHLGSPRYVVNVNDSGDVPFQASYSSFGEVTGTGLDWMAFGFAGGIYDSEAGLVRFGARDLDPMVGRWTAKDPLRFENGNAPNLYIYADGDPANLVDLTGRQAIPIPWWGPIAGGAAAGAAVGGAAGALVGAALACLLLTGDTPADEPAEICTLAYEVGDQCVYECPSGAIVQTKRHGLGPGVNPANDVCPRTIVYG